MGTSTLREVRLRTEPDRSELEALRLGDVVYLDGTVYTAREGIYKRVVEDGVPLPLDLPRRAVRTSIVPPPRRLRRRAGSISARSPRPHRFASANGSGRGSKNPVRASSSEKQA